MATQITQIDDLENRTTTLRVDGEMSLDDALLLERIATGINSDSQNKITLDLADLDLLDSEAAPILKRLADREGFAIEGIEIFVQTAVDGVERHGV